MANQAEIPFSLHKYFIESLFTVYFIMVLQIFLFAQNTTIDNLKKRLAQLNGTDRIDCLNELGYEYSDRYWSKAKYQRTDSAYMFTMQALNESQQLNYSRGIGKALQNLGTIEEEHGNYKAAEFYIRKAMPVLKKENMLSEFHRSSVLLGWILHNRGFFEQSISIYKAELPYYEGIKDSEHIAAIYRIIARAYDIMGNSEDAFNYFQKNFNIQKKTDDSWGKRSSATLRAAVYLAAGDTANAALNYKEAALFSLNQHVIVEAYHLNMAIAYRLQKNYDSALMEMRSSIKIIQSSNTDSLFRRVALMKGYEALADLFLSLKKYDSAIKYCRQPLIFFQNGDDKIGLMEILKIVATSYYMKHENVIALRCANQLLSVTQHTGARKLKRDAYKLLWQIYAAKQNRNSANVFQQKYILLNDSLQNDKYISQTAAWKAINDITINEVKYASQLKLNEERYNANIDSINNKKKTQLYFFILAIGLLVLFTVLIIRNNMLKRKRDQLQLMMTEANIVLEKQKREQEVAQLQQQKTELEMQALRAQMNPHFIFNCLNSINRFIMNNDAIKAADYLTKFAKLIRFVLEQSGKPFVLLEDEIACLKLYMDLEALRFEKPFHYTIELNGTDSSSVMIPTMLIQPFVENAIWHGLRNKEDDGKLVINIHLEGNILHCSICDNGIGRSAASKEKMSGDKKSFGIKLTQDRLRLISFNYHTDPAITISDLKNDNGQSAGTRVDINFPVQEI